MGFVVCAGERCVSAKTRLKVTNSYEFLRIFGLTGAGWHPMIQVSTTSQRQVENMTEIEEFEYHAAKAFFASAWADAAEDADCSNIFVGAEILDILPKEIDPAAILAARQLRIEMEQMNNASFSTLMLTIEDEGSGDRSNTVEFFGHYAAMQAIAHGVGLWDAFGKDIYAKISIPYIDFSMYHLSKDYF